MKAPFAVSLYVAALAIRDATAFTTQRTVPISPLFTAQPRRTTFQASSAAATNGEGSFMSSQLKTLEKKEAKLDKQRVKAMAQLAAVEESLNAVQTARKQYLNGDSIAEKTPSSFTETTVRSAVKAFMWRIIAGSVTFVTSLRFSGSMTTALSIVGSDFFSKSITMFIGERLMNKSQAGRESGADGASRSLIKALIWRLFAICNTLTMAVFISKDLSVASKIAGSDAIFKTALMFGYERVWSRIEWGKEYEVAFFI